MAIARRVGHDKNGKIIFKMDKQGNYVVDSEGNKIIDDDLPIIASKYKEFKSGNLWPSRFGFTVRLSEIRNHIFIPSYYDPETTQKLKQIEKTGKYKLVSIEELVKQGLISVKRGHEVGSKYYGMGDIPFVRTSDIVNWEIKIDPIKSIPEEVYQQYKKRQDIGENDILLVTDGTFLIGRTAIVTPIDKKIVIQSHITRIKCLKPEKLHPYLLLYLLNTEIVQKQIEEKTFVQATISTIGERLYEIIIPIPTDNDTVVKIINEVSEIIKMKVEARMRMESLIRNKEEA
jgi:type I restriction enzyme M protein